MNDSTRKTSSSLAITEKRPHRPGGCVGIFFQLFDWNRRLAKKKLFSKKFLPPARAKQASKKFGGNEKLPAAKLHLIADENRGGFPNVKKNGVHGFDTEQKLEMRAPGLVARLMGLESMPAGQRDKPNKASGSENYLHGDEKFVGNHCGSEKEDASLEKGQMKQELRPQKLQKTGLFERRPVTRFGAEALQFKSVLSRSRKHHHHHPKLTSPVKSPRVLSGRNASRLIDAATKILEPGLQATSRTKCALTYSNSAHHLPKSEVMTEGTQGISPELLRQTGYHTNAAKSVIGQSSCKNCGNLLDVVDVRPNVEKHPSVFASSISNNANSSSQGSGMSKPRPAISSLELERNVGFQNSGDRRFSLISQVMDNVRAPSEPCRDGKLLSFDDQERWHLSSQPRKPQKDEPTSIALKHMAPTQNQMSLGRDRIPARSKVSNPQSRRVPSAINAVSGAKDFVALNRNLSGGRSRTRMPTKADNSRFDVERKSCNKRDDSSSQMTNPVRKRRTINVNGQIESTNFAAASTFRKQTNVRSNGMTGKGLGLNTRSQNQSCIESKLASHGEDIIGSGSKNIDVISFTFNSPMKPKTGILSPKEMEVKRTAQDDFIGNRNFQHRKLTLDENDGKTSSQKLSPLRGDALGALIDQKLKELTCQEEDELATCGTSPKRTTAMILQELIYALTAEQPISQDDGMVGINQNNDLYLGIQDPPGHVFSHKYMFNTDMAFQSKAKAEGTSVGFSRDVDHHSPGSVLEATFSNDSCISGGLDDSSVLKLHHESMDYSYDQPQPSEPDADLLDSATSLDKGRTFEMVTDLVNHVSKILCCINQAGATELTGSKLTHLKEVILNAELLFGNPPFHYSDGTKDFLIGPFLLDGPDIIANASMWTKSECCYGFEEIKGGNQRRRFLFDCVMEYLDSKYVRYCNAGFKAWTRRPSRMNTEILMREVNDEVRRWKDLAGKIPDEIIEYEMSYSLGKWTDFEIEGFETGAEIDRDILQILVDEIVTDLCEYRLSSF